MQRAWRWHPMSAGTSSACAIAGAFSLACTWLLLDVATTQRGLGQLSRPGSGDWLPFVAVGAGGMILAARSGDGPRARLRVAVSATAAFGLAAFLPLVLPGGGGAPRLLLQALGLGLVLGCHATAAGACDATARSWQARSAVVLVAALLAAAGVFAWSGLVVLLGPVAAGIGSLLTAVLAACTLTSRQHASSRAPRGRASIAALPWCVAACLLWLAAPRALWHGGSPEVIFYCALVAVVACTLAIGALGTAVLTAVAGVLLAGLQPQPRNALGSGATLVAASAGAAVVYQRATQELQLYDGGQLVVGAGPDRIEAELAATLLQALLAPGDRVLVLGCGDRLAALLLRAAHEVEIVHARPDAAPVSGLLLADGPIVAPEPAEPPSHAGAVRVRQLGLRPALVRLPDACRQAIVVAEPLGAASWPQVTLPAQRELARVAGRGLVAQVLSFDRTPARMLRALFAAAAIAHGWNAVFAVGESAVLLSAAAAPDWPPPAAFAAWSDDARWIAHRAHLGDLADLQRACLGTLRALPSSLCWDDEPWPEPGETGRKAVLEVLHEHVQPAPDVPVPGSGSVLLHWVGMQAQMRAAVAAMRELGADAKSQAQAAGIAARFLPTGAPAAMLQAALGLPDAQGVLLRDLSAASLRAHAIDPTFLAAAPAVFAQLPRPRQARGDLEDLATLPAPDRLREWCTGDSPRAVALRARFGSRCARVLVEALAQQPLHGAMYEALRELADPFVLAAAGHALTRRSAVRELLGFWRCDLPMPQALDLLRCSTIADRRALLEALPGRSGRVVSEPLADFLVAPEHELRRIAAVVLRQLVGDVVPYDPDWPSSALNEAADKLRAMHNRNP